MKNFLKGYRTLIFNAALVFIGILEKLEVELPHNAMLVIHELLSAVGVQAVDGSTLITIGMAGLMLRWGTTTPIMSK